MLKNKIDKLYLWDIRLAENGYVRNFHKTIIDEKFITSHPHIPRIFYDRHSVGGWESNYTDPEYTIQFFNNTTDIEIILPTAWKMWKLANRYGMEEEALRSYLREMDVNINAAFFLKKEALKRWEWLSDTKFLKEDLKGWLDRVEKRVKKEVA
jgi:hypothetical protein